MAAVADPALGTPAPITVSAWPSEKPLTWLAGGFSLVVWLAVALSIVGLIYAALIGTWAFFGKLLFVAHVRGNGVRLGPDQLPDLHARVQELSVRFGLERVPETYVLQEGGTLNALATRFLGADMMVLFSDLLDACGSNTAARDMIIGHELGHIRAGHLRGGVFLAPASITPFFGAALSRAREYTCDRWGAAAAGDRAGALLGLAILAVGGRHAHQINERAFADQSLELGRGVLAIGEGLSSHPPLARRLAACDALFETAPGSGRLRG